MLYFLCRKVLFPRKHSHLQNVYMSAITDKPSVKTVYKWILKSTIVPINWMTNSLKTACIRGKTMQNCSQKMGLLCLKICRKNIIILPNYLLKDASPLSDAQVQCILLARGRHGMLESNKRGFGWKIYHVEIVNGG